MACRRSWSFNEERVLVNALKELVSKGQKCDNGFKSGYLNLLEAKLMQEIPGTDLRGEPHINSKIHVWKKLYAYLREILGNNGSGAGLDSRNMVDVTDDKWESLIKGDKGFKKIRNKAFPFYQEWIEIFGKDRANGDNAQTAADVLQEPPVKNNHEPQSPPHSTSAFKSSQSDFQTASGAECSGSNKGANKKRKIFAENDVNFIESMSTLWDKAESKMGEMTAHLTANMTAVAQGPESPYDSAQQRRSLWNMLEGFTFIDFDQKVKLVAFFGANPLQLDSLYGIPEIAQAAFLKNILKII